VIANQHLQGLARGEQLPKDFYLLGRRQNPGHGRDFGCGGDINVFGFFSSEKNILACATLPATACGINPG
jgi:hypothetical protein